MSNTFTCMMCAKEIAWGALIAHVPRCYRQYCANVGMVPLCTCAACEGRQTHPTEEQKQPHPDLQPMKEEPTEASPLKILRTTPPPSSVPLMPTPTSPTSLTPPTLPLTSSQTTSLCELMGKVCIVCGQTWSPSTLHATDIPIIFVGHHHKVMVCKKAHLAEAGDCAIINLCVTMMLHTIYNHSDTVLDDLMQALSPAVVNVTECAGLTVAVGGTWCGE